MTCTRTWEVEAARDGRLSKASLDDHERHVLGCESCREEGQSLEALARALREPPPSVDAETLRRLRARVVGDARRGSSERRIVIGAVLVAAALVLFAVGVWWRPAAKVPVASARVIDVKADASATWSRRSEGAAERITLTEGTLHLTVEHGDPKHRLVVMVPDGEIEDIGTVFHVTVVEHRTTRVVVDEGSILLRLREREPVVVNAGAGWEPPAERSAPTTASATASVIPPSKTAPSARPAATSNAPEDDTAAEDASYLRTLQLLREGRNPEAKAEARLYLRRFPKGFRRAEMSKIAE